MRLPLVGLESVLAGETFAAWWYDPRTGAASRVNGDVAGGEATFAAPPAPPYGETGGPDWVLVLDDASQGFPPPGTLGDDDSVG